MNPTPPIKIACVQTNPVLADVPTNLHRIEHWLTQAATAGARLAAFTECALTGYMFESREEALPHAQPIPGPATRRLSDLCRQLQILAVCGLIERAGDDIYNACVLTGPDGLIASYRKIHLPYMGVDRFAAPGQTPFEVVDAGGLRLGLHICYDAAFPESCRQLSLLGADLLILPTNWPRGAEPLADHMMACRAMENVVYTMAVDRVGEERDTCFIGGSGIYDPFGRTLAKAGPVDEELLIAEIEPARARNKLIERIPGRTRIHRFNDRRPEFYTKLLEHE